MATAEKTNRDYEIENAARTLLEAEKIKKDKTLYQAAIKELEKQRVALSQVLGAKTDTKELLARGFSKKEEG